MNPSSFQVIITALVALFVTGILAEVNFEIEFDDFPGFRYIEWTTLPPQMQQYAVSAGYDETTWNTPGQAIVESSAWDDLSTGQRTLLSNIGFSASTWDCYVNHYDGYSWADLAQEELTEAADVLGYTQKIWDSNNGLLSDVGQKDWDELSDAEQRAAAESFCYFSGTWNEMIIPEMNNIPTIYPYFRYIPWEVLPAERRTLATSVGYDEDSWDTPGRADLEYIAFSELDPEQRQALIEMGFYEEQYDCFENHYYGYTWEKLQERDLAQYYEAFEWTEEIYNSGSNPASWDSLQWDQLSDTQKEAGDQICWFEELWDEVSIDQWGDDFVFPTFRFTQWSELSGRQQLIATSLGYTDASWDTPGTNVVENSLFENLSEDQQHNFVALGFYSSDQYNCYVNHYEGLDWADLAEWGVLEAFETLGWNEDSWKRAKSAPASEGKDWDELNEMEKDAADQLCYFSEIWDKSSLQVWEGVAWPEDRYSLWDDLNEDEQLLLQSVGYSESSWDTPGSIGFEFQSWSALTSSQREGLMEYGFYEDQWDCYMAHYDGYEWFELVLEGVAEYFEIFGWTEESWETDEEPWTWTDAAWDDLSFAMQDAAWEICYFRETWDDIPISSWPDTVLSGVGAPPRSNSNADEGKSNRGLWIKLLLVVVVAGIIFIVFQKKRQSGIKPTTTSDDLNLSEVPLDDDKKMPEIA